MQKHWFLKLISTALVLVLLFQMLPVQSLAVETESPSAAPTVEQPSEEPKPATVIGEAESLRTETGKHFRLSDGSFLAVNYGTAVHYQDNSGDWQEINNRPVLANNQAVYVAQNGNATTAYAAALTTGNVLSASYGNASVSMQLLDTAQALSLIGRPGQMNADAEAHLITNGLTFDRTTTATVIENNAAQTYSLETDETQGWTAEDLYPAGMNATVLYEEVFPGVDLQYTAYSRNIKEQIIIHQAQSAYRYDFFLALEGLVAALNEDGSITLVDEAGNPVYSIPAPYMEDSAGMSSDAVAYTLTPVAGGAVLTVTADKAWIESEDRVFPVYVDPTLVLTTGKGTDEILSVFAMEAASTTNTFGRQYQYVGNMPVGNNRGRYRMYLYFENLPDIPDGAVITNAQLRLYSNQFSKSGFTQIPLAAYDMTTTLADSGYSSFFDWFARITWKKQPTYDTSNAVDYVWGSSTKGERYFDLTEFAQKWYTDEDEASIAIVAANEDKLTTSKYAAVRFYGYGVNYPPLLAVEYRHNVGIEPYYTYATLGAGSAGTAYIADGTGQLKVAKQLVSYASTINSFAMNLVYNSDYFNFDGNSDGYLPATELGTNMELGHGWTLDIIQRMEAETIGGTKYLKYTDGDGTIHYFARVDTTQDPYKDYDPNLYYDEDGLKLKVEDKSGNSYVMSDDNDNKWIFTDNLLTEMADANGNKILIVYNANKQITKVQQQNVGKAAIVVATFAYSGNVLQSVTDVADNVYTLVYTAGELTAIQMTFSQPDEDQPTTVTIAEYTYDSHRLNSLKDTDSGYKINAYYDAGKVNRYNECVTTQDGTEYGVEVSIEYENAGKTTYRDYGNDRIANTADDILTSYLFDYAGRTANVYTTDAVGNILGASNAVYSANNEVDKRNNRTLRSASIGVAAQQLLLNSGFEDTESNTWTLGNGASLDTSVKRTGNKALKMAGSTTASKTTLPLTADKTYTLSGYINTDGASFASGATGVQLLISGGGEPFTSEAINYATSSAVDGGWVRVSVTFEALQSVAHTVTISGSGITGSWYVDDLQLEVGEAPSNRNLLENGSMETSNYAWTHTDTDTVDNTTPVSFVSQDGRNVLRILGNPDSETTASTQTVMLNLPSSQTYVLSGWAKADAVPDNMATNEDPAQDLYKQCGLRAILYYADDSNTETEETEYHYAAFNSDLTEWQFTSLTIVPKQAERTVEKIDVICAYERNANIAYFDNLSLVREVAQTYTYDQDGNLVSVTTTGLKEETDTYENGNLIQSVTGGQGTYSYAYNNESNKHLVTAASNGQITQTMTYDTMGNATGTTLFATPESDRNEDGTMKEDEDGNKLITEEPSGLYLQTSAEYSADGNLQTEITDSSGSKVTYDYGTEDGEIDNSVMWGLPTSVTAPNNTTTTTIYDAYGRITNNHYGKNTQNGVENYASVEYNYNKGLLETLTRSVGGKNQTYTLVYDDFGNVTSVKVGSYTLITNTYGVKNGQILRQTYGNGASISYTYDSLGRVKTETYRKADETITHSRTYTYTGDGQLYSVKETQGDITTTYLYTYDTLGRLIGSEEKTGSTSVLRTHQTYNEKNQLTGQSWQMGSTAYADSFTYNETDGSLNTHTTATGKTASYSYDVLRRLQSMTFGELYTKNYTYRNIGEDQQTTTQVASVTYANLTDNPADDITYGYTYDLMGNTATYNDGDTELTYVYDTQGQLTQVKNGDTELYAYTYDAAGNILTAFDGTQTHDYTYGDTSWADLLTAYDGQSITYDAIGNPTSYFNGTRWNFAWQNGRRLATATDGTTNLSFAYDADGMRTAKTVNGVTHTYIYAGGKLMRETYGTNTLDFFYDASGMPYAVKYNNDLYYYITTLQGDILHIVNGSGEKVVSYEYGPYGQFIEPSGTMAETLGAANPLRYRGYYYDVETGLYYLQSRYYDPSIGRFINADGLVSTGQGLIGNNVFSYCLNNPIIFEDHLGSRPINSLSVAKETASERAQSFAYMRELSKENARNRSDKLTLAQTIYGETGGRYLYPDDWQDGMLAVAACISYRLLSNTHPNDFASVCTQPGQFDGYSRGKNAYTRGECDPVMWDYAMQLADEMVTFGPISHPKLNSNYLYFHSEKYGDPETIERIRQKEEMILIGGNMFYINWP